MSNRVLITAEPAFIPTGTECRRLQYAATYRTSSLASERPRDLDEAPTCDRDGAAK